MLPAPISPCPWIGVAA